MEGWTNRWTNGWTDGWTEGWTNKGTDRWIKTQMDGQTKRCNGI